MHALICNILNDTRNEWRIYALQAEAQRLARGQEALASLLERLGLGHGSSWDEVGGRFLALSFCYGI